MSTSKTNKVWEILVPRQFNDGRPVRTRFHKVWDKRVMALTGGLTVMPPNISGKWIAPDGLVFAESMIPVRIVCDEETMETIAEYTKAHYEQIKVMYYCVSEQVYIV